MCVHKNLTIYVSSDGQSTHSGAKRIAASKAKAKAKAKGKSAAKKGEEGMADDLEEEEEDDDDDDIDGEPIDDEDHQGDWDESCDGMDYSGYSADNWNHDDDDV